MMKFPSEYINDPSHVLYVYCRLPLYIHLFAGLHALAGLVMHVWT